MLNCKQITKFATQILIMKIKNTSIIGFIFILLSSCSNYTTLIKSRDYEQKYNAAKQYFADKKYTRASMLLMEVIAVLKGTDKGEESLFLLAMCEYNAHNYDIASDYFKKYYDSYPNGVYVEDARYYSGLALYWTAPDSKLDQTETLLAITEFQNFLDYYPETRLKDKTQKFIFELQDKLIQKEYNNAKLYYNLGDYFGNSTMGGSNYQACIITAENALKDYPYTTLREAFSILLVRAKFYLAEQSVEAKKEERYQNAIDECYGFSNEFSDSKYSKETKKMLEISMNAIKKYK